MANYIFIFRIYQDAYSLTPSSFTPYWNVAFIFYWLLSIGCFRGRKSCPTHLYFKLVLCT